MLLLVVVITVILQINLNNAFYDQIVLDRFGLQPYVLDLSNVNITTRCNAVEKKCIWKCCPIGEIMRRFKMCSVSNITFTDIKVYNQQFNPTSKKLESVFELVPALLSEKIFAKNSLWWFNAHLIEDGRLFLNFPNMYDRLKEINTDHFCVEMKLDGDELRPVFMAEYEIDQFRQPNTYMKWALIISIICVILTFTAYVFTPQLRNQNGVIFMIYLGCLIAALITRCILENFQSIANLRMSGILTIVFFHYFFRMSSFCWMNVIFYRILRNENKSVNLQRELMKYCAYAFLLPVFLTVVVATIELSDMSDTPWFVTPQIQNKGNFSFTEKESLYYLYIPLMLLLGMNWFVCYMKVVEFCKNSIQATTFAVSMDRERNYENTDLNKPMNFVKLLAALTTFTLIDMLSVVYPEGTIDISAIFTMFFGVTVMVIFVYGQKVAKCCSYSF